MRRRGSNLHSNDILRVRDLIRIKFEPIVDTYMVVPDYITKPVVLGRFKVIQDGSATANEETYFAIKADEQLIKRWHLLLLLPSVSPTESRWSIVRVEEDSRTSPSRVSAKVEREGWAYHRCAGVGHKAETGAFARFLTCEQGLEALVRAGGLHSQITQALIEQIGSQSRAQFYSPIWLTCGLGCCEVRL